MNGSARFITAYNQIDDLLHGMADLRPQVPFTEAVRLASAHNAIVRRYADDLYAYGRLRNAIVHSAKGNEIIAEPHEDVVEDMEKIFKQISRPASVREVLGERPLVCISARSPLLDAVRLISKHRYSNIPVLDRQRILGVLTPKDIVVSLGAKLAEGADIDDWFAAALVADVPRNAKFSVCGGNLTAVEAIERFEEPKLRALILTSDGTDDGKVEGIVTGGDLVALAAAIVKPSVI